MFYIFLSVLAFFIIGLPLSALLFSKAGDQKSTLEVFILTSVVGPLIINYLIVTLGYAGLLSRENMFLVIFAIVFVPLLLKSTRSALKNFCVRIYERIRNTKSIFGKMTLLEAFPLGLVLSIMIITSYSAFTLPPVLRDPYAVWLFYGKKIMETKTIPLYYGNAPDISWSGNYPPLISFLASYYFIGLGQAIPEAFTHVSWLYGGLTLLITFMLARALGLGKMALMSACLLTTASLFTLELVNYGYVTIAWSFYVIVACFYFVKCMQEKTLYAVVSFGLSLGAALLSTYLSFIFMTSLVIVLLATILIRKFRTKNSLPEFKPLIIGLIMAFVVVLPWLIRNYVLLGNPVYPWFYELFASKGIILDLIRRVPQPRYSLQTLFTDNTFVAMANEDIGYTLLIFGFVGALYLAWRRKEPSAHVGWLTLTFFTIYIAFMSSYYGYERYLLMVAPLLAVSAGYLLDRILSSKRLGLKLLAMISILIFSLPSYSYLVSLTLYGVPVGETGTLGYIEHYIDDYVPQNAVILTNEIQLYFINRQVINIYNLPAAFQAKNLTELTNSFKANNITHILINDNIDPEILENTPLISILAGYTNKQVLLDISPYTLYEVGDIES